MTWISIRDAMAALRCSRVQLHRLRERGSIIARPYNNTFEYRLDTLPQEAQEEYWKLCGPREENRCGDAEIYAAAPEYARRKADKYLQVINASGSLSGRDLKLFITAWNADHPENRTSYARLMQARKDYRNGGVSALLGGWGKRSCVTSVPDDLYAFFKSLYLSDGRPSAVSCWQITLGHAVESGYNPVLVPSQSAFMRRLKKDVPEQAVYTAREGAAAANKKYGFYIKRNYDDLLSGESWISDHAQIDVAVRYSENGRDKVGYPWVTAWRDFKSGKWVGWDVHIESPDSNHIFAAFYRAAIKHGVPSHLYLDNGKDYRVKDFTGGRRFHKIVVDEGKTTALTGALGIVTTFAWPYNAQSKSIERDFNRNKEWFSKHAPGYRGGNVVERPEAHNETIARGGILTIEELSALFDLFITDVIMQARISSGYRKGKCPQQIWDAEYPQAIAQQKVRHLSKNALMLFCTRVSGVMTIGRRGIRDSKYGVDYYAEWMEGQRGRKVYIRRDITAMEEAWVFDATTDAYIDNAWLLPEVAAVATNNIQQQQLKKLIAVKRNSNKLIKTLSKPDNEVPFHQKIHLLATAERAINEMNGYYHDPDHKPVEGPIFLTDMDKVYTQREESKKAGTIDLSALAKSVDDGLKRKKRHLTPFESEINDLAANA